MTLQSYTSQVFSTTNSGMITTSTSMSSEDSKIEKKTKNRPGSDVTQKTFNLFNRSSSSSSISSISSSKHKKENKPNVITPKKIVTNSSKNNTLNENLKDFAINDVIKKKPIKQTIKNNNLFSEEKKKRKSSPSITSLSESKSTSDSISHARLSSASGHHEEDHSQIGKAVVNEFSASSNSLNQSTNNITTDEKKWLDSIKIGEEWDQWNFIPCERLFMLICELVGQEDIPEPEILWLLKFCESWLNENKWGELVQKAQEGINKIILAASNLPELKEIPLSENPSSDIKQQCKQQCEKLRLNFKKIICEKKLLDSIKRGSDVWNNLNLKEEIIPNEPLADLMREEIIPCEYLCALIHAEIIQCETLFALICDQVDKGNIPEGEVLCLLKFCEYWLEKNTEDELLQRAQVGIKKIIRAASSYPELEIKKLREELDKKLQSIIDNALINFIKKGGDKWNHVSLAGKEIIDVIKLFELICKEITFFCEHYSQLICRQDDKIMPIFVFASKGDSSESSEVSTDDLQKIAKKFTRMEFMNLLQFCEYWLEKNKGGELVTRAYKKITNIIQAASSYPEYNVVPQIEMTPQNENPGKSSSTQQNEKPGKQKDFGEKFKTERIDFEKEFDRLGQFSCERLSIKQLCERLAEKLKSAVARKPMVKSYEYKKEKQFKFEDLKAMSKQMGFGDKYFDEWIEEIARDIWKKLSLLYCNLIPEDIFCKDTEQTKTLTDYFNYLDSLKDYIKTDICNSKTIRQKNFKIKMYLEIAAISLFELHNYAAVASIGGALSHPDLEDALKEFAKLPQKVISKVVFKYWKSNSTQNILSLLINLFTKPEFLREHMDSLHNPEELIQKLYIPDIGFYRREIETIRTHQNHDFERIALISKSIEDCLRGQDRWRRQHEKAKVALSTDFICGEIKNFRRSAMKKQILVNQNRDLMEQYKATNHAQSGLSRYDIYRAHFKLGLGNDQKYEEVVQKYDKADFQGKEECPKWFGQNPSNDLDWIEKKLFENRVTPVLSGLESIIAIGPFKAMGYAPNCLYSEDFQRLYNSPNYIVMNGTVDGQPNLFIAHISSIEAIIDLNPNLKTKFEISNVYELVEKIAHNNLSNNLKDKERAFINALFGDMTYFDDISKKNKGKKNKEINLTPELEKLKTESKEKKEKWVAFHLQNNSENYQETIPDAWFM